MKVLERLAVDGIPPVSFMVAVRLLERLLEVQARVGAQTSLSKELIRFSHQQSLMSQPNEVSSIRAIARYDKGEALPMTQWIFEVATCFLGLTGTDSPLPLYLTSEFVQEGEDMVLQRAFLDIFHNRILALFYRGISRYDFPGEIRRDGQDLATWRALAFAGFDLDAAAEMPFSRVQLLHVSGLFSTGPSTPRSFRNSLRALLRSELGDASVELAQFTGGWVELDPDQRNSIGQRNHLPGRTFVIGTRVRHPGGEARIVVGPLDPVRARRFSPGGPVYRQVTQMVGIFCPTPVNIILELHVRTQAYPPFILGKRRLARDACASARRGRDDKVTISRYPLPMRAAESN